MIVAFLRINNTTVAKAEIINSDRRPNSGTDGEGVERLCGCGVEAPEVGVASGVPLVGASVAGVGMGVFVVVGVGVGVGVEVDPIGGVGVGVDVGVGVGVGLRVNFGVGVGVGLRVNFGVGVGDDVGVGVGGNGGLQFLHG